MPRPAVELRVRPRPGEDHARTLGRAVAEADTKSLRYLSLPRVDMSGARMSGVDLGGCDLSSARFDGAELDLVNFEGADLTGASFDGAIMSGCRFGDGKLRGATFRSARVEGCEFTAAAMHLVDMSDAAVADSGFLQAEMHDVYLDEATFHDCRMHRLSLSRSRLVRTSFRDCGLHQARLAHLHMVGVTFDWDTADRLIPGGSVAPTEELHFEVVTMDGGGISNLQVNRGRFVMVNLMRADIRRVHLDTPFVDGLRMSEGSATRFSMEAARAKGIVIHDAALDAVSFRRSQVEVSMAMCKGATALSFEGSRGDLSMRDCEVSGLDLRDADLRYGDMRGADLQDVEGVDPQALAGADRVSLADDPGPAAMPGR